MLKEQGPVWTGSEVMLEEQGPVWTGLEMKFKTKDRFGLDRIPSIDCFRSEYPGGPVVALPWLRTLSSDQDPTVGVPASGQDPTVGVPVSASGFLAGYLLPFSFAPAPWVPVVGRADESLFPGCSPVHPFGGFLPLVGPPLAHVDLISWSSIMLVCNT